MIIGRSIEVEKLKKISTSQKSEFVAIYGRRRVGKTFLIREFFDYNFDFQLTGLANADTYQQLVNFHTALNRQSNLDFDKMPATWFEAFQHLMDHLENIKSNKRKVIFLDELPWLDTKRSDFLMALEHFWNSWATNRKDIILITCGSAASWMISQLINNHGGLHNRVTERIKINPFNLKETEELLRSKNNVLNRYQILQLYMVMGGIPYYLDAVSPEKSAAQNIEELCFQKDALLAKEFNNLYQSLFKNSAKHIAIIKALATKRIGLTRKEITITTKIPSGGSLTKLLEELEESGFISKIDQFKQKSNGILYRLSDFYSLFYLKFIDKNSNNYEGNWINAIDNPVQRNWLGHTFEQICLTHISQIKKALGISGVLTNIYTWRSQKSDNAAQIDLVIDRRDQVVNLCEIKYSINNFTITKSYSDNLRNKIGAFKRETKTKKSIFLTMITTYGVEKNSHAAALVQNSIMMDALFEQK